MKHGQNIAGRVLEPCYVGALAAVNALFVGLDLAFVALKFHAALREFIYGFFQVIYREIEHSEGRRLMVRLRVDNYCSITSKLQTQDPVRLGDLQPKNFAIELLRPLSVIY